MVAHLDLVRRMRAIAVILALVFAASASAQPHVQRPAELSDSDWSEIKSALAKYTHDEIRTIRVSSTSPLSVQVDTASPHIVTEGDFTLQKVGSHWQITKKRLWIH